MVLDIEQLFHATNVPQDTTQPSESLCLNEIQRDISWLLSYNLDSLSVPLSQKIAIALPTTKGGEL